jgi:site-specific DNA recombinase
MAKKTVPLRNYRGARALLLPRVSTVKQAEEGTSLETQEREMRRYCQEREYEIVDSVPDAFSGTDLYRPALNTARDMMHKNLIDVIVIFAYDRFFRDQTYQTVFIYECRQQGVAVESATEQVDDSFTGHTTQTFLGVIAEIERAKILERTQRGLRQRVESGKLRPGSTPIYGYKWVNGMRGKKETHDAYEVDEEAAAIVRFMYEKVVDGMTLRAIANHLNKEGVLTPTAYFASKGWIKPRQSEYGFWIHSAVRQVVKRPAYIGQLRMFTVSRESVVRTDPDSGKRARVLEYSWKPEEDTVLLPPEVCPPIVDEVLWQIVQDRLKWNKEQASRRMHSREAAILSRGHIFCGICLRPAYTHYRKDTTASKHVYTYRCAYSGGSVANPELRCPQGFNVSAHIIDTDVWDYIVRAVSEPGASGKTLLEETRDRYYAKEAQERQSTESVKGAAQKIIEDKERERKNLERALDNALKSDYNETLIDHLQLKLDTCYRDIASQRKILSSSSHTIKESHQRVTATERMFDKLQEMLGRIHEAEWKDKRHWLYLLGIQVFVYPESANKLFYGRRWRVRFGRPGYRPA